jgi:hypothetical protein
MVAWMLGQGCSSTEDLDMSELAMNIDIPDMPHDHVCF